jgi:hypothetical protein
VSPKLSPTLAYCGFDCADCPAYKATQSGDIAEQKQVASRWSKAVGKPMSIEQILCDGCRAGGGRMVAYCAECPIRLCAVKRDYPTCAHCPDMSDCGKIIQRKTRRMLVNLKKKLGI